MFWVSAQDRTCTEEPSDPSPGGQRLPAAVPPVLWCWRTGLGVGRTPLPLTQTGNVRRYLELAAGSFLGALYVFSYSPSFVPVCTGNICSPKLHIQW